MSAVVWWVGVPIVHAGVPWALSGLGARHGWTADHPVTWNLVGLGPVAVGTTLLLWVSLAHLSHANDGVEVSVMSRVLVTRGPYAWSRNPMYVAELSVWLGWTVLFGSIPVLVGAVALWVAMTFIALPWEERALEAKFSETYLGYKRRVPRWLGRRAGGGD
jgi:protein-S-isoprenylcysteine O-methyltransferase Ste14